MLVRKSTEFALVRHIKPRRRGGSMAQVAHNLSNLRAFYAIFVTSISGHKAHLKPAHKHSACMHVSVCSAFICKLKQHTHVHTLKVTQTESIVALVRYSMRFPTYFI